MMLSNEDIKKCLETGELKVEPFTEEVLRGSGMTLHLGRGLLKPLPGKTVDVKDRITPDFREITLEDDQPYVLEPGEFLLGHTYQRITVGPSLGFLIEGRSTLARVGLTIVQTAMLVYPGHRDRAVTLELANHGVNPIALYAGMKIARVALIELKTPSSIDYDKEGKYRNQEGVGAPIFKEEIMKLP